MDGEAVKALKRNRVDCVISANEYPLSDIENRRLSKAGIKYLHLPVQAESAPTLHQFRECFKTWRAYNRVHFYCGAGDGRVGTFIMAIKIVEDIYETEPTAYDYDRNQVSLAVQRKVLVELWNRRYMFKGPVCHNLILSHEYTDRDSHPILQRVLRPINQLERSDSKESGV